MNINEAVELLKERYPQGGKIAWKQFCETCCADNSLFQELANKRAILQTEACTFRFANIVTPDECVPEENKIRIPKRFPDAELNYPSGVYDGLRMRETPHHVAFYKIENLLVQQRYCFPNDSYWQTYLPNGDIVVDNTWAINEWNYTDSNALNIAYLNLDANFGVFTYPKRNPVVTSPTIPIIGRGNYYHFMVDQLPMMIMAQNIETTRNAYIGLVRMTPMQQQLCETFGINMKAVVELEAHVPRRNPNSYIFKEAYLPAFVPMTERLTLLRHALRANNLKKGTQDIFIGRKASRLTQSRLTNQESIEKLLSDRGFRIVYAEDYSVAEQREIFSHARIIVGIHGAGLSNLMFAPRNCFAVELLNKTADADPWRAYDHYRRMSVSNGQSYFRLVCPLDTSRVCSGVKKQDLPMICPPEKLLRTLDVINDAISA